MIRNSCKPSELNISIVDLLSYLILTQDLVGV